MSEPELGDRVRVLPDVAVPQKLWGKSGTVRQLTSDRILSVGVAIDADTMIRGFRPAELEVVRKASAIKVPPVVDAREWAEKTSDQELGDQLAFHSEWVDAIRREQRKRGKL